MSNNRNHQIIDPTNLTHEQSLLLNTLLEQRIANKISVWDPLSQYKMTQQSGGTSTITVIELTHRIIYRSRFNPVTEREEARYEVLAPGKNANEGSFSRVFDILGTLAPTKSGSLQYKTNKSRLAKVQHYFFSQRNLKDEPVQAKKNIQKEGVLSLLATHLHAKQVTFDELSHDGYLVLKKFPGESLDKIINSEKRNVSALKRNNAAVTANHTKSKHTLNEMSLDSRLELSLNLLMALQEQIHDPNQSTR